MAGQHQASVLLIDDSSEIRNILRQGFEAAGFRVCAEAAHGVQGIARAKEHSPDLIVLDQSMPVMNGMQAAPELRRILPSTPIVLFTFYGLEVSPEQIASVGISSVVTKPDIDGLIARASTHLQTVPSAAPSQAATPETEASKSKIPRQSAGKATSND